LEIPGRKHVKENFVIVGLEVVIRMQTAVVVVLIAHFDYCFLLSFKLWQ
jgi:hypothetical protein